MYNGSLLLSLVHRQEEAQRRLTRLERFSGLLVTLFTLVVGVLIVFTCLMADYQARVNESNALLGWMIYYFVFWLLPMQDYKLGLAKQEGKHLLSWIFLCGFHLLFLDAYCTRIICKALGSHSRFPPHLLLAVAALPLPILVLAIPIKVYLDMTRRPQLVFDRPGVPRRSFGNPSASGASSGANSKRDPLPPPSYSEVEGLDLPDYRDLEFADENFKLDCDEEEVVGRKADVYAVDKEMERGDSNLGCEVTRGASGEVEEVGGWIISRRFDQETEDEQRGTLPKMNTTEKSGEDDVTSGRSIFVQIDEAKNQVVATENQMVDTEEGGKAILGKVSVKEDQDVVEHVALLEPAIDQPGVSELQNNECENEGEVDILDGKEMDKEEIRKDMEASAKGEEYKQERIEMREEEKKENRIGNMEEPFTKQMGKWQGGEGMRDTAGEENKEEYLTREGGKEERREMEGEVEKEKKEEEVRRKSKVGRREEEGQKDPVPPVWDTVLVQHGDLRGTQV